MITLYRVIATFGSVLIALRLTSFLTWVYLKIVSEKGTYIDVGSFWRRVNLIFKLSTILFAIYALVWFILNFVWKVNLPFFPLK